MDSNTVDSINLPLKIPFFQMDLKKVSTDRLREYNEVLDEISYCIDTDSPATVDVWRVISRLRVLVRYEINSRKIPNPPSKNRSDANQSSHTPVIKKRVIRPVKAKK